MPASRSQATEGPIREITRLAKRAGISARRARAFAGSIAVSARAAVSGWRSMKDRIRERGVFAFFPGIPLATLPARFCTVRAALRGGAQDEHSARVQPVGGQQHPPLIRLESYVRAGDFWQFAP